MTRWIALFAVVIACQRSSPLAGKGSATATTSGSGSSAASSAPAAPAEADRERCAHADGCQLRGDCAQGPQSGIAST